MTITKVSYKQHSIHFFYVVLLFLENLVRLLMYDSESLRKDE